MKKYVCFVLLLFGYGVAGVDDRSVKVSTKFDYIVVLPKVNIWAFNFTWLLYRVTVLNLSIFLLCSDFQQLCVFCANPINQQIIKNFVNNITKIVDLTSFNAVSIKNLIVVK